MKKNGFTLTELMVALAVVAIASAFILPAATKLMPDNNKIKVANVHSKIVNTTIDLLNDDAIYYTDDANPCEGLACTQQASREYTGNNKYSGEQKYEHLMQNRLGLEGEGPTYTDADGLEWTFSRPTPINTNTEYTITIDVNGNSGPNSVYSNNQEKPDQFRFCINNYGGVKPDDAMTAAYLSTALNSRSKEDNLRTARNLYDKYYKTED